MNCIWMLFAEIFESDEEEKEEDGEFEECAICTELLKQDFVR